jgi:hypothetical protein
MNFFSLGAWLTADERITFLGDEEFYVLLLPILYWSFDQMIGLRVGMMLLLSNGFNTFFKFLFRTPRPFWISDSVTHVHESSFGCPPGMRRMQPRFGAGWRWRSRNAGLRS